MNAYDLRVGRPDPADAYLRRCDVATERRLSTPLSEFARTLLTDFPIQGILDDLVVRIAEVLPIGSAGVTLISSTDTPRHVAASDDSISTVLVPLGELDYFSVRQLTDAAAAHMVGTHRSVTFDLSAVSFCDSSIGSLLNWVGGRSDELDVTVITGSAVERVLGLLTEGGARRPPLRAP